MRKKKPHFKIFWTGCCVCTGNFLTFRQFQMVHKFGSWNITNQNHKSQWAAKVSQIYFIKLEQKRLVSSWISIIARLVSCNCSKSKFLRKMEILKPSSSSSQIEAHFPGKCVVLKNSWKWRGICGFRVLSVESSGTIGCWKWMKTSFIYYTFNQPFCSQFYLWIAFGYIHEENEWKLEDTGQENLQFQRELSFLKHSKPIIPSISFRIMVILIKGISLW